ncbi:DUF4091 domain-containing protein [Thermopirellula anaerolimosa]
MTAAKYFALLGIMLSAWPVQAELRVWTTTATVRVLRDDPPGDTAEVRLFAARNEWRGFQILMRSDRPIAGISVAAGNLSGPNGSALPRTAARLYRQHQFELTAASPRNDRFRAGWYPDALIPVFHPLTGAPLEPARYTAMPFDLPAEQTHGFWIDLFVPRDAAAGTYRGVYRLTAEGQATIEIPVSLTVWNFALPDVPTVQTALGSPADRMRGYYQKRARAGKEEPPSDWAEVEEQCAALVSEHRINATPPRQWLIPVEQPDGSFRIPEDRLGLLRDFVDRYHVNAVQTPHPSSVIKDPAAERDRLGAWLAAWDAAAQALDRPNVVFYTYLKDEPNDAEAYQYVQTWGRAIKDFRSALKVLVVEQTWTQDAAWGDLYGAVDIWCPLFCLHRPESALERLALGETVWTYTALCQGARPTPWWQIDFPLLHYRVPLWMAWNDRMRGILYWGGMAYWDQTNDPWTDPWTYGRRSDGTSRVYNGEGTLVYPAGPAGYEGIVPSLRLKALRDGIQDYEYLAMLERAGQRADAEAIVRELTTSFFAWNPDPSVYDQARQRTAEILQQIQAP